eukprot:g2315.t1
MELKKKQSSNKLYLIPRLKSVAAILKRRATRNIVKVKAKEGGDVNVEFYSDEKQKERENLRYHTLVVQKLNCIWTIVSEFQRLLYGDGIVNGISFEVYQEYHRCCSTLVENREEMSDEERRSVVLEDWNSDMGTSVDKQIMPKQLFLRSVFELCDIWVNSIDVEDYVKFLEKVLMRITVRKKEEEQEKKRKQELPLTNKKIHKVKKTHEKSKLLLPRPVSQGLMMTHLDSISEILPKRPKTSVSAIPRKKHPKRPRQLMKVLPPRETFGITFRPLDEDKVRLSTTKHLYGNVHGKQLTPASPHHEINLTVRSNIIRLLRSGDLRDPRVMSPRRRIFTKPLVRHDFRDDETFKWNVEDRDMKIRKIIAQRHNEPGCKESYHAFVESLMSGTWLGETSLTSAPTNSNRFISLGKTNLICSMKKKSRHRGVISGKGMGPFEEYTIAGIFDWSKRSIVLGISTASQSISLRCRGTISMDANCLRIEGHFRHGVFILVRSVKKEATVTNEGELSLTKWPPTLREKWYLNRRTI